MQKFDTPTPVTAVLDVPAGRIHLIAADRTDTAVEVRPADATKNRDVKAAQQTEITYTDGTLHITAPKATNQLLGAPGAIEITVQLPTGSHIQATAASAELRGVGRLGDVTFDSACGSAKLDETTAARLTLQSGDLTVGRLNGPAQLSTHKGDLRITEATCGTLTLRTDSGDIHIGATRGACATLDAGTTHGRIHNALTNTGTNGTDADLTIHATTSHGDITARSL
ncbi:DUF4097 family beta strand repeat-containing protein [Streptosporangium longisporum]|uniref:DUF4097 family beta strand repeat-containing protein n=1 Tax=Streptosporangium longisporum TaxID=46187 RepID=A0ABP6KNL4_9ACTN